MRRVSLQPAYILHRRPYRESSFLVELFTPTYGRLTVIAKGVRKAHAITPGLLQPFVPLLVSWVGRGELMTLSQVECKSEVKHLSGECLFAGFYLNELLMHLLQKWDAHTHLYTVYEETLTVLQAGLLDEKRLRLFEKFLLEELGYAILPNAKAVKESTFLLHRYYRFIPEQGLVLYEGDDQQVVGAIDYFLGKNLWYIAKEEWDDDTILRDAKRLMRLVLMLLLGDKTLHSRRLFINRN